MNQHIVTCARILRNQSTEAEKRLWYFLGNRNFYAYKFRRQHPISPYIVDFFCPKLGLIIELDGGQHNLDADARRTTYLEGKGYKILRFWNNDVLQNTNGVLEKIALSFPSPDPISSDRPLPKGEVD